MHFTSSRTPSKRIYPLNGCCLLPDAGPGVHSVPEGVLNATAGQTIYLAGGAVLMSPIRVLNTTSVTIGGCGVIYHTPTTSPSVDIENSSDVVVDGIIRLNPKSSCFLAGQSEDVTFRKAAPARLISNITIRGVTYNKITPIRPSFLIMMKSPLSSL